MSGSPIDALKKTPIKTGSGDLQLVPVKANRYQILLVAVFFQCLLLVIIAQSVAIIMEGNLFGILLILIFFIPGSAIIWLNYFKRIKLATEIHIDTANGRIEIEALPVSQAATFCKYRQESYYFPFQDIDTIQFLPTSGGIYVVQMLIKGKNDAVDLCSLPILQARHLARHISGLTGCGIQIPPGDEPLSPLPPDATWDPDSERKKLAQLPRTHPYPAIIFSLLVLAAALFKYFDQRPPIWFYLGIYFQVALSAVGVVFLIKGPKILANAWDRLKYIFLFLLSFFLFLSLYLPNRGLFPLLIGCIALLMPVALILKSSSTAGSKSLSTQKRLLIILSGIIIAAPFTGYGYFASKEVYGFFSQPRDDITGIAFYEIKPSRHAEQTPTVIVRQNDQISEIMGMLQESVPQNDPRRVEYHYLMQIRHLDGTSFFATIGRMKNNLGCILFSSKFGLWGWHFGGYDNYRMIKVLKRNSGLWPDV